MDLLFYGIGVLPDFFLEKMRRNLQDARRKKGLTQRAIAQIIGTSYHNYRHIEYERHNGGVKLWDKLEDLLGVPQRKLREKFASETKMSPEE
jgi:DNA-binding XRE family transcriptional regulator